ncbi:MAG: anthranilate synthase component I [Planctomycetota bacterium]|nr:MAG: anthranilate synthase component I [Planctomycetota bacterium]
MSRYLPQFDDFKKHVKHGNTIPVYCELLGDHFTPVTAFEAISENASHAFLLESVVGGENIARYSFLAADPQLTFEAKGDQVVITGQNGESTKETISDPLHRMSDLLESYRAVHLPELPRFAGGIVGYAGYDIIRYYEPLPDAPEDDRHLPDLLFGLYDTMVVFDHVSKTILVVSHAHVDIDGVEEGYKNACRRIDDTVRKLSSSRQMRVGHVQRRGDPQISFTSNFKREGFEKAVEACKEYIRAGDIFQVVLSQRLQVETAADPFDMYRALRVVNPSPFMFYVKSPTVVLVGASPEIMCRVEDGVITNRPLAGTRRRGRTQEEDKALEEELLADPKERAEHIMLVDLGRNDVGRVAELGSVELTDLMVIERYSHVMHISSNVRGKLAEGMNAFDALRVSLPVGTVSGAPKVRAMQIIDEFEPTRRGPYAGAVGYVDFAGNMDTCIALRTMVITPGKTFGKSSVYIQVGAGIVADSQPHLEYKETINKAKGMLRAIEIAETGFE